MVRLLLLVALAFVAVKANEEADLFTDIVSDYPEVSKYVRPVAKVTDKVTVDVTLNPIRIISFTAKGGHSGYGTLTVAGWMFSSWTDINIGWDPSEYAGISSLTIPIHVVKDKIWMPDVLPYDGLPWDDRIEDVDLVVMSNGLVMRVPPGIFVLDCAPNDAADAMVCQTSFGSWTRNADLVDVGATPVLDTSFLAEDPDWTVEAATAERVVKKFDCCPEPYSSVKFSLTLKPTSEPFETDEDAEPKM